MLDNALSGSKKYWAWMFFLSVVIGIGTIAYLQQLEHGLVVTGLSRDVSWGLYIGQLTFLVGVAASAVMLVIPYYLHDYKKFGKIVILGKFLAIPAVIMCMLFIFVDLGQPAMIMNVMLYPNFSSVLFWDSVVLNGYLVLNIVIGWTVLHADKKAVKPPSWVKPLIYLSIPWAISIHTVTAFLFAGLPGRDFWLNPLVAPMFLASAFAAGPALLIILAMIVRKFTAFDAGKEAIQTLAKIVTYAMVTYVFFLGLKFFTAAYSGIPGKMYSLMYLYAGLDDYGKMVPIMLTSSVLALLAIALLIFPSTRKNEGTLMVACVAVFLSLWLEKGFGFVLGGFIPNPFGKVMEYWPTMIETLITMGVWAIGLFILTVLYKMAIGVREKEAL